MEEHVNRCLGLKLTNAFVLQNDSNRRSRALAFAPVTVAQTLCTTISHKSRTGLSKFTYELVRELDKSRRNTLILNKSNGEPRLYMCNMHVSVSSRNAGRHKARYGCKPRSKKFFRRTYICMYLYAG